MGASTALTAVLLALELETVSPLGVIDGRVDDRVDDLVDVDNVGVAMPAS